MENVMTVIFSFGITVERAESFIEQLKAMCDSLPQPASGSIRSLNIYSFDTEDGEQRNVDLEYFTQDQVVIMAYYLVIDHSGVVVTYSGPEKDFGAGDVGPYFGIDKEITEELRIYQ